MTKTMRQKMLEYLKLLENCSYEVATYRAVLEQLNPPGWRELHQKLFLDWKKRHQHHKKNFEKVLAEVEQLGDPDFVLKMLELLHPDTE
jgi:hypothetical protein